VKYKIVPVKNIQRLLMAYEAIEQRSTGEPGLFLVHGVTGAGKSTAVTWLMVKKNAVFIRAQPLWTPSAMVEIILREMGLEPGRGRQGSGARMVEQIMQSLAQTGRPLFVDEADHLIPEGRSYDDRYLEILRGIHDTTGVPVLLSGMAGVERRIASQHIQFNRRILRAVEFQPIDLDDMTQVVTDLCEVQIEPDLIEKIHTDPDIGGSIGYLIVALSGVESYAKQKGWTSICAAQWGHRPLLPRSGGRRK
jgi:DNA transposition AAA+ family ATPase